MAFSTSPSRIILGVSALAAVAAVVFTVKSNRAPQPAPVAAIDPLPTDPASLVLQIEARLKTNPDDVRGWRFLGAALRDSGRFAEGAIAWKRAVRLDPDDAESWASLGEILALGGPTPPAAEARAAFQTALKHDPGNPRAAYYLAIMRDMAGDHHGALDALSVLLARAPAAAPWAADVRKAIDTIAATNKIDISAQRAAREPGVSPR
jgi:cytochrome c-type biogenesis protein CcmH